MLKVFANTCITMNSKSTVEIKTGSSFWKTLKFEKCIYLEESILSVIYIKILEHGFQEMCRIVELLWLSHR